MEALTSRWLDGGLSEADYTLAMRELIKALHMGGVAAGRGGIKNVTKSDLSRLGPVLRDEYRFLTRRIGQYQAGEASREQVLATVGNYALHARGAYENTHVRASGATEVRRVLHAGESCRARGGKPGCVEQAARKWHDVKTFVPINDCACGSACRCTVETRKRVKPDERQSSENEPR